MKKQEVSVKFRVTSYEGDSDFELPSSKAFSEIKKLTEEQNKWVFIDGNIKNNDLLTEDDLIKATEEKKSIILLNALAGGNKLVDIEFSVTKQKESIVVNVKENKYAKIVNISVSEKQATDILRNRTTILNALKLKLESLTEKVYEAKDDEMQEELDSMMQGVDDEIENTNTVMEDFAKSINYNN